MKKIFNLITALFFIGTATYAQDAEKTWKFKSSIGADFAALLQINPKVGAGDDRIGFGGNAQFQAAYAKGRAEWINSAGLLMTVQKIGDLGDFNLPFQKASDAWFLRSNFAYALKEGSKFSYWAGAELSSQIAPTYTGNLLNDTTGYLNWRPKQGSIAEIFAPATFTFAPGLQWNPMPNLKVRVSPASLKMNIVANDRIANVANKDSTAGLFGNPWRADGDFDNVAYQLGGFVNVNYNQGFIKFKTKDDKDAHRIVYTSNLNLYSNYLKDPQYVDVDWQNTLDFFIVKGLSIRLLGNLWYDHDFDVITQKAQVATTTTPAVDQVVGKGVSFTTQLLLNYTLNF